MAKLIVHSGPRYSSERSVAVTAALVGVLSFDDVVVQKRAIKNLLMQVDAVLLDVAGLRIQHGPAVRMLSDALLAAGGWPSARLVVVQPDGRVAAALEANGVSKDVHIAKSIDCALAKLGIRPMRVSRRAWIRRDSTARRQARAVVNAACDEWDVSHLVRRARIVTDRLLDNARTPTVLKVSLDDVGMRIALRDFRPPRDPRREPGIDGPRSLKHALCSSDSCGITPLSDGMTAWVVLKNRGAK